MAWNPLAEFDPNYKEEGENPALPKVPSLGSVSQEDRDLAIRTVWGEASDGTSDEIAAVANVINNRAKASGKTPRDVVFEKGQFEPWMRADRRRQMENLTGPDYDAVARIVDPILRGEAEDITGGATHFYAPYAQARLGRKPPEWDDGSGQVFGRQKFFKLPYGGTQPTFGVDFDPTAPTFGAMGQGAKVPTPLDAFAPDTSKNPLDEFASGPPVKGEPSSFGSVSRGKARLDAGETLLTRAIADGAGLTTWDPVELGKTVYHYKTIEAASPPSEEVLAGQKAFAEAKPGYETIGALADPAFLGAAAGESLPTMLSTLKGTILGMAGGAAVGAVGGPVGAAGGAVAGAGVGSGFGDAGMEMLAYIEKVKNPQTEEEWTAALSDPHLVNEALWAGVKHGGIVGLMDVVGLKAGGALAGKFLVPGTTRAQKAMGIGGGFATSVGTEAAGEAGGQLAAYGKIDPKDVILEAVVGGLVGGPADIALEPTVNYLTGKAKPVESGEEVGDPLAAFAALPAGTSVEPAAPAAGVPPNEPPKAKPRRRTRETAEPVAPPPEQVVHRTTLTPRQQVDALVAQAREQVVPAAPVEEAGVPKPTTLQQRVSAEKARFEEAAQGAAKAFALPMSIESRKTKRGLRIVEGGKAEKVRSLQGKPERILQVAVEADGKVFTGGILHSDVRETNALGPKGRDGFVTSTGRFVDRAEAFKIADAEDQIYRDHMGGGVLPTLASEDLKPWTDEDADAWAEVSKSLAGEEYDVSTNEKLRPQNRNLHRQAVDLARGALEVAERVGITIPLKVNLIGRFPESDSTAGMATHIREWETKAGRKVWKGKPSKSLITLAVDKHVDAAHMWATLMHELGHTFFRQELSSAPRDVKYALQAEYRNWRRSVQSTDALNATVARRDSAASGAYRYIGDGPIYALNPLTRKYWLSYDEFLAEQFAKWGTTRERPVSVAEKWLKRVGRQLKKAFDLLLLRFGVRAYPNETFANWLDELMDGNVNLGAEFYSDLAEATAKENSQSQVSDGWEGVPAPRVLQMQPAVEMTYSLFGGSPPAAVKSAGAQADRLTRFGEWSLSLPQLAKRNLEVRDLQNYREDVAVMTLETQKYMQQTHETIRLWNKLTPDQSDAMVSFLDDYSNMVYLKPSEVKLRVVRKPTKAELAALISTHKLSAAAVNVFGSITRTFDSFLAGYEALLVRDAAGIANPAEKAKALASIKKKMTEYRNNPYFPWMRFGDYVIVMRDGAGNVVQREHYTSEKRQLAAQEALNKVKPKGYTVSGFIVPKTARAFVGMPPGLLDKISEKLGVGGHLTAAQQKDLRETLELLRFEYAPAHSFKHRFQRKARIKGYSHDFKRAFAHYGFYGSRHLARVKYVDQLKGYIKNVRDQAKFMPAPNGNLRAKIGNFMQDHIDELLNPHNDLPFLRGITFFWYLGWMPASAALNLSQMLITSYPFLAQQFGDAAAVAEMGKAALNKSTYYKKATLESTSDPELRMLGEISKEGLISEARAPELAALSEGRNLLLPLGNKWQKTMGWLAESGAFMFSHAEQMNRRVTALAALRLAMKNPAAAYVRKAVKENARHYQRLKDEKIFNDQEIAAIVTAADAVKATQFEYNREAQPKFMRGHKRTLFAFKIFQQNMLFFLGHYKPAAIRSFIVMGFLGGLMGLPFGEEIKDLLKIIGWHFFGKDFDIEREAREYIIANTSLDPDLLLNGTGRYGFGIPAAMDMLGGTVGLDIPVPTLDRSRAMGLGRILPLPITAFAGPPIDANRQMAEIAQQSAGAAFGIFFNMWKGMQDIQTTGRGLWDFKTFEKGLPRVVTSVAKAGRYITEGAETTRSGATVARFDPHDAQHMAEVLAVAMGYTPLRVSQEWDVIRAKAEVAAFWNLKKEVLLRQADRAFSSGDQEAIDQVVGGIRQFNADLPKGGEGKAITTKILRQSLQTRARLRAQQEAGIPRSKQDYGLMQEVERLYPEAVDVQKVR